VVHKYFCDGGGYWEADHPQKDEKGNKFNGHMYPINHSPDGNFQLMP
jgi:hypothetical protein